MPVSADATGPAVRLRLDPEIALLHQPVRLQVMGLLWTERDVGFAEAKRALALTEGNLASHVASLEKAGMLASRRVLLKSGFGVRLALTPAGSAAFARYLEALRAYVSALAPDAALAPPSPPAPGRGDG